jgi:hypothetical protein
MRKLRNKEVKQLPNKCANQDVKNGIVFPLYYKSFKHAKKLRLEAHPVHTKSA